MAFGEKCLTLGARKPIAMKTKTMKTIQLWMLALVLIISSSTVLTSCSKDDTLVPPSPPQPVILQGEAAVAWTRNHLDSLVNVYLASCGNLLDPDMTRDLLSCIGYTRLNVFDYREAGWLIDSVVLVRLMDRATERNNKTILFTMGMYGCGKTTSINNNPKLKKLVEEAGVVSEGAYNNVKYFDGVVEDMDKKGFVSSLIYVYNDAETGYTNCMERLISSNRAVTCEAYISVFPQFQGRVEYIEEHHPDMPTR